MRPFSPPDLLNKGMVPRGIGFEGVRGELSPGGHMPPAPASNSASPTPRERSESVPMPVTILPGTTHALPNIANLKSGCSDGLLLLSSTAYLVARDAPSQGAEAFDSSVTPPAKRARAATI